jgi:hypothetical protein
LQPFNAGNRDESRGRGGGNAQQSRLFATGSREGGFGVCSFPSLLVSFQLCYRILAEAVHAVVVVVRAEAPLVVAEDRAGAPLVIVVDRAGEEADRSVAHVEGRLVVVAGPVVGHVAGPEAVVAGDPSSRDPASSVARLESKNDGGWLCGLFVYARQTKGRSLTHTHLRLDELHELLACLGVVAEHAQHRRRDGLG